MFQHLPVLLITAISFGVLGLSTHKITDQVKIFGSLIILFPALLVGISYVVFIDSFHHFEAVQYSLFNFWWVFLLYAPLVWISNWFRTRGVFHNNFTSTSILINFSIVFSLIIESLFFQNKFSVEIITGVSLLFVAAYLTHTEKISFNTFSWFILAHCFLASINRNIDFYLITNHVNLFTVLFWQEVLIVPALLILSWNKISGSFKYILKDRMALVAMVTAFAAIPFSFITATLYGPSETLLSISSGWLVFGLIENYRSLGINKAKMAVIMALAFVSIYLMVV